jgi:uncharacterized membrane protein
MERFVELAGRLHPMLVHLPIGILLIAIVLLLLAQWEKIEMSRGVMHVVLGAGSVMAVTSCVSGFVLSQTGDYDTDAIDLHQWMAVFLTLTSLAGWYLFYEYWLRDRVLYLVSFVVFFSLAATGHMGASLTHGASYLTEPFSSGSNGFDISQINSKEARFYADAIAPIFQHRCQGCHGPEKQKGKLRLDDRAFMLKGGKTGPALVPASAGDSDLWNRILLPLQDEDHMPPKEKGQLSEKEKELIKLWIETGADFEKKIDEVLNEDQIAKVFRTSSNPVTSELPEEEVSQPDPGALSALRQEGVSVTPVSKESNYLSVNFVSLPRDASRVLPILNELSQNVVWLKLTGCELQADNFQILSSLVNLRKLSLDDTNTTDADLRSLVNLPSLVYLNLKGTQVSLSGIEKLKELTTLRELYLFQTNVTPGDRQRLQSLFESAKIDFGDYQVPTLASDTTVLSAPKN